ncbi:Peroxide-responsive repressor PerR [Geodia barretti]|uniref:Peroxide-responsive repressor PerR n=1 Tax=Geodia barretti TaxID=519541 RepID=A0AA35R3K3_GEOBA|nr:Peroxide-responsive repressor PerR [Geodia barretti]
MIYYPAGFIWDGIEVLTTQEDLVARLKPLGIRLTPQRLAIAEVVVNSADHPPVRQVFERVRDFFPYVTLATVYSTLGLLEQVGIVRELHFQKQSRYDANLSPHANLVCLGCGAVVEGRVGRKKSGVAELERAISLRGDFQAENSRAALVTFTTDTVELIPLTALDGDLAAQTQWLQSVRDLETKNEGAFILDAVDDAHEMLITLNDSTRRNVIVLLTDGADGGISELDGSLVVSEVDRATLVEKLKNSQVNELAVHTIGLWEEADHGSLMVLSEATENGRYIYASR